MADNKLQKVNELQDAQLEEKVLSINTLVGDMYATFRDILKKKHLKYSQEIKIQNPCFYGDEEKIREIYTLLLSNACKYAPNGGRIDMSLEELPYDKDGWALYKTTVSDTGIGISSEFLPHIFEELVREKNSSVKVEGSDMPSVKRLVESINGTIEVASEQDKWTAVTITTPHQIA